jgi:Obg family GTPase CgtA
MFIDKADITIKGGDGGAGSASFRREKYVPWGGPDGGDGGAGGDAYLVASVRLRTLLDFVRKPSYQAERGESGRGRNQYGKHGEDLVLEVPCGTSVYKGPTLIADLLNPGDTLMIATEGAVAGQVNGLSVIELGSFAFAQPIRITAPPPALNGSPVAATAASSRKTCVAITVRSWDLRVAVK